MPEALFAVDMGTTRTRAWLLNGDNVEAHRAADVGVRNVAAGETSTWLEQQLLTLLDETYAARRTSALACPTQVAAAGMITSAQGIAEVPHVVAPAGAAELAAAVVRRHFAARPEWEITLVPGVRTDSTNPLEANVMRGEETLAVGLLATGTLHPGDALLTLGSHWKWIWIDESARIAGGTTSLTGELIHAAQANTLLAASLPQHQPEQLDPGWVEQGRRAAEKTSLGEALFAVRLLQQRNAATEDQRLSFFYGAFLHGEVAAATASLAARPRRVIITGPDALAQLWRQHLAAGGHIAEAIDEPTRQQAYLLGLKNLTGLKERVPLRESTTPVSVHKP